MNINSTILHNSKFDERARDRDREREGERGREEEKGEGGDACPTVSFYY